MKPAWDKLGTEFADSSSVLIGDADCTVETELCSDHGVKGYPTIKYFPAGEGAAGAKDYSGGRDFDSLKKFAEETLAGGCDVDDASTCDEKENAYNTKMRGKGAEAIAKQLKRLEGMKNKPMKPELKKWMMARLNILTQLAGKSEL